MKTLGSQLAAWISLGRLRRRVAPFVRYVALLVGVVLVYGVLFHVIMAWEGQQHSWFTGIYWALTVMSTLGFGDITFESDLGRIFSSVVLLSGIVLLMIILPFLFIRFVYAPWLEERLRGRVRELRSAPADVRDHVLICSDDAIAPGLARRLGLAGIPAYLIESDPDRALALRDAGLSVLIGEIDSVETYRAARAQHARLVFANASDMVNSNIVLTVRELSESVPVAAVAEAEDSIDVLELSGATHVLPLKHRLGEHLANRASAVRSCANVIGRFHDLLLVEFPVRNTPLEGKSLEEARLEERTGVTIVGVWDQAQLEPVHPRHELAPLSAPVAIGTQDQIDRLDDFLGEYDVNPNPVLVIGGGKVGRAAALALKRRGVRVHVVERQAELEAELGDIPDRLFIGDAADRRVLDAAGIAETPSILLTTHDDAMNVYLSVYCRRLNPGARILSRVTHERNIEAIRRAGANFVLSYASLGVQTVVSLVRGREIVVLGEDVNLFFVSVPTSLAGKTLSEAAIQPRTGLSLIAIQGEGRVVTDLPSSMRLPEGGELILAGSTEQRTRFSDAYA